MMLSKCTQLIWSTMARTVLRGTCPVKPLYGLGHRAAAQFQGLVPVAQWLEHCVSSAKVVGSNPREHTC